MTSVFDYFIAHMDRYRETALLHDDPDADFASFFKTTAADFLRAFELCHVEGQAFYMPILVNRSPKVINIQLDYRDKDLTCLFHFPPVSTHVLHRKVVEPFPSPSVFHEHNSKPSLILFPGVGKWIWGYIAIDTKVFDVDSLTVNRLFAPRTICEFFDQMSPPKPLVSRKTRSGREY